MEYEKCLVQLDEILKYLSDENLQKIPNEIKEFIKRNHDFNEEKLEKEKQESNIFKNNKKSIVQGEVSLIQIKEDKWYNKVFYFIKWIFKRK